MIYETNVSADPSDPVKFKDPLTGELYERGLVNIYVDTEVITGPEAKRIVEEHREQTPPTTQEEEYEEIINVTGKRIGPFREGVAVEGKRRQMFYDASVAVGTHGTFGYNDPEIEEEMRPYYHLAGIKEAGTDHRTMSSHGMNLSTQLSKLLNETANKAFGFEYDTKFAGSGSYANEDALKAANYNKYRQLSKELDPELFKGMFEQLGIRELRDGLMANYPMYVISFKGAFHGRTAGALSMTDSKPDQKIGIQLLPYVKQLPYDSSIDFENEIDYTPIEELIRKKELKSVVESGKVPIDLLSMIMMEPVQGEGGYIFPDDVFLQKLNDFLGEYKDKKKFVFAVDEVQAGMGRTGYIFAIEHYIKKYPNLKPDIITMAKALHIGAAIINEELLKDWPSGKWSGTWNEGHLTSIARGYYTLEKLLREEPDTHLGRTYLENARKGGEELREGLRKLAYKIDEKHPKYQGMITGIRGRGQMTAFDLPNPKIRDMYRHELWLHGVMILPVGAKSLRTFGTADQRLREREILLQVMESSMESLLEKLKPIAA